MTLRTATPADLNFILDLQRKFHEAVGFLPGPHTLKQLSAGNVLLATDNDDEAGFLLVQPRLASQPTTASIHQACVCLDARRQSLATQLVRTAAAAAIARGQTILQCSCATDLEANLFWQYLGFRPIATRAGGQKRGRTITLWRLPLTAAADLQSLPRARQSSTPGSAWTHRYEPIDSFR